MVDGHEMVTDEACGRCGKNPADGFASANGVRYCHSGESPTCYELRPVYMHAGHVPMTKEFWNDIQSFRQALGEESIPWPGDEA